MDYQHSRQGAAPLTVENDLLDQSYDASPEAEEEAVLVELVTFHFDYYSSDQFTYQKPPFNASSECAGYFTDEWTAPSDIVDSYVQAAVHDALYNLSVNPSLRRFSVMHNMSAVLMDRRCDDDRYRAIAIRFERRPNGNSCLTVRVLDDWVEDRDHYRRGATITVMGRRELRAILVPAQWQAVADRIAYNLMDRPRFINLCLTGPIAMDVH